VKRRKGRSKRLSPEPAPKIRRSASRCVSRKTFTRFEPTLLILGLIMLASLAFVNSFSEARIHDDKFFVPLPAIAGQDGVSQFFFQDAWAHTGAPQGLYRPLLLVSLAADRAFWGEGLWGYHFTNVMAHVLATLLVFGLARTVLIRAGPHGCDTGLREYGTYVRNAGWYAAGAAAVFAVHPVHTEAVNSIFNRSEMLATIGVIAALWLILSSGRWVVIRWGAACVMFLLALYCKESAISFPVLAGLSIWLLSERDTFRKRVLELTPLLATLGVIVVYLVQRQTAIGAVVGGAVGGGSAAAVTFFSRLERGFAIIIESLRMVVLPYPSRISFVDADLPGLFVIVLCVVAVVAVIVWERRRGGLALSLGLGFFTLALLPGSRIFIAATTLPLPAERLVYLPSAGLALALALGLRALGKRTSVIWPVALTAVVCVVLLSLSLLRNEKWNSEIELFEAEYQVAPHNQDGLRLLTGAYASSRRYDDVVEICDRHLGPELHVGGFANNCAIAYVQVGDYVKAEGAYKAAARLMQASAVHANLARLYMRLGRYQDAQKAFEDAITVETSPARKNYRRGHMLFSLYFSDPKRLQEAEAVLLKSLELQPDFAPSRRLLDRVRRQMQSLKSTQSDGGGA